MNNRIEPETLEDVLEAFASSDDVPDSASLAKWIRQYPQYEEELTDFAVHWLRMEHLPPAPRSREADTETLVLRSMSIFQNIRYKKASERAAASQPLEGIAEEAARRGLTLDALAAVLKLSPALVRKLDRRLIAQRIPMEIKDALATVLGRSGDLVDAYLRQPPSFARGARHRADRAPTLGAQEDFFDAVRADVDLREEWRRYWLDREPAKE